ncbi:MAG: hypothetical protein KDB03_07220 [Planctomycetales bacterium]|nr:hypothetical protein [Planctomycetales bacterium]
MSLNVTQVLAQPSTMQSGRGCDRIVDFTSNLAIRLRLKVVCNTLFAFAAVVISSALPPSSLFAQSGTSSWIEFETRIVWGGDTPQSISGSLEIPDGSVTMIRNLCLHSTAPQTVIQHDEKKIEILPHEPSLFGGLDVQLRGNPNSKLKLTLNIEKGRSSAATFEIELGQLLDQRWMQDVGPAGYRIAIERQMLDRLRLDSKQGSSILGPGEDCQLILKGFRTGLAPGDYQLKVQLAGVDGSQIHQLEERVVSIDDVGDFDQLQVPFNAPKEEGAYILSFALSKKRLLPALGQTSNLLSRCWEFAVFDSQRSVPRITSWETLATGDPALAERSSLIGRNVQIGDLPAATTGTRSRISTDVLKDTWHQLSPLGLYSDKTVTYGELSERQVGEHMCLTFGPAAWQAIPLPVVRAGHPHRLVLQVPIDQPMQLAFGIRESNVAGEVPTINLDVGVYIGESDVDSENLFANYEILFWPKTDHPYLLCLNPASLGTASIARWHLQQAVQEDSSSTDNMSNMSTPNNQQRLVGIQLDKPFLVDGFGARRARDSVTGRAMESWLTWQETSERLVQYMEWIDANTLILNIYSDGGSIFPNQVLQPSFRFDTGTFFSDSRSPDLRDALELLMRHCDRANIRLIVALEFDGPLPRITQAINREPDSPRWQHLFQHYVNSEVETAQHHGQLSKRYNPLEPQIQSEFEQCIREIVQRYGGHRCFAGLSIQLTEESQLLFAGDAWGYNSSLLSEFSKVSGVRLPEQGLGNDGHVPATLKLAFLDWRAAKLTEFFDSLGEVIQRDAPQAQLYLNALELWEHSPGADRFLQPDHILRNPAEFLQAQGISTERLSRLSRVALIHGTEEMPLVEPTAESWMQQTARSLGLTPLESSHQHAALVTTKTKSIQIQNHETLNEAAQMVGGGWMYPHLTTIGKIANRRLIEQLFLADQELMVIGGWLPYMGAIEQFSMFNRTLRELPIAAWQPVGTDARDSNLRAYKCSADGKHYLVLINNASWPESLSWIVSANSTIVSRLLGGRELSLKAPTIETGVASKRNSENWQFDIPPYDMLAIEVSADDFTVESAQHHPSADAITQLRDQLADFEAWLNAADDPTLRRPVSNFQGIFESWRMDGSPVGWTISSLPDVTIQRSDQLPHSGRSCLMIENSNLAMVSAWVQSQPFAPPSTGRLRINAWLRMPATVDGVTVRLSLFGRLNNGSRFERTQVVGTQAGGAEISLDWGRQPITVDVADLPIGQLSDLTVAVDLIGPGRIWLDDVEVLETCLHPDEFRHLRGKLFAASQKLEAGNLFPAEQLVRSYWMKHLRDYIVASPASKNIPPIESSIPWGKAALNSNTSEDESWLQQWRQSMRNRWRR